MPGTTNPRRYVKAKFPNSARAYTYHLDSPEPLEAGDQVQVETTQGAIVTCDVLEVSTAQPSFATKPCRKAQG